MAAPADHPDQDAALATVAERVHATRRQVVRYLDTSHRRRHRLSHVTIVGGALSATLTGAPALGGKPFADWVTEAFALGSPSWQLLCGAAALCSLAATIATQMDKAGDDEDQLARAQETRAALDALELDIATGRVDRDQAATQLIACVEQVAFIHPDAG